MSNKIAVIGGGIVGTSCALALQQRGLQVSLFDPDPVVKETSYGNAGVLSTSSVLPMNNAKLWGSLPSLLKGSLELQYRKGYLAKNLPWLVRFMMVANQKSDNQRVAALYPLVRRSIELHRQWLELAGEASRLRETGWIKAYSSEESFSSGEYERACLTGAGVSLELLDGQQLGELEPALQKRFAKAVWVRDSASVDNPAAVVTAYRQLFQQAAGELQHSKVERVAPTSEGFNLFSAGQQQCFDQVVVALGPWSNDLLDGLGEGLPMLYERGYHQHFTPAGEQLLQRPVFDVEGAYVAAPMQQGYRITSGVELASRDAQPSPQQLEWVIPKARQMLAMGEALDKPWMGRRPTLPDALPAIGQAKKHPGLWIAAGHSHIGFSTGPASGELIADMLLASATRLDAKPFSVTRL